MPFDLADTESWLDVDLALLTSADAFRSRVERPDLQIGSRPSSDDPNDLFRGRLPVVDAAPAVVFEGFVHRILEYHHVWTREYAGGHVVPTPDDARASSTSASTRGCPAQQTATCAARRSCASSLTARCSRASGRSRRSGRTGSRAHRLVGRGALRTPRRRT